MFRGRHKALTSHQYYCYNHTAVAFLLQLWIKDTNVLLYRHIASIMSISHIATDNHYVLTRTHSI